MKNQIEVVNSIDYMTKCHDIIGKLMETEVNKETIDRSRFNALKEADDILFSTMKLMLAEAEAEVMKKKG
jgi:hypothetical protein